MEGRPGGLHGDPEVDKAEHPEREVRETLFRRCELQAAKTASSSPDSGCSRPSLVGPIDIPVRKTSPKWTTDGLKRCCSILPERVSRCRTALFA